MRTLEDYLNTQDISTPAVKNICDNVLNNAFDGTSDPLTEVIVTAFTNNDSGTDLEGMSNDLGYAIGMLSKVKKLVDEQV